MRRHLVLAAALVAVAAPGGAQDFPATPPAPMPVKAAQFPPFKEATLANGLKILVVENHKLPLVSVDLSIPAGTKFDPKGKSGIASAVASLLTKGAGSRTADQFAAAIEGIGGSISAGADDDLFTVSGNFLAADATFAMGLLGDVVLRPKFDSAEVELWRTQTLSGLTLEQSQPGSIAGRIFAKELFGAHPYGRRADPTSVKSIARADIQSYHSTRLRPRGALLVFAGDITLEKAKTLAEATFKGWTGAAPATTAAVAMPDRKSTEIVLVHRAGSVQSNILVGNLTWGPADPHVYGARVANQVLGGGGDSRLFLILREQKGWTYGAYSGFNRLRDRGYFQASAEVRTEVTDSSLVELLAQVKRITSEPISAKEFEDAKSSLVGRFPLQIETAAQVASQVAIARQLGLPNDYVQTFRQKLAAVTPDQALAAAKAGIKRDATLIVVVGDGAKIYDKLKGIAPVRIVSVEGAPLKAEDLVVKAGALDADLSKLAAQTDSFAVLFNGNAIGGQSSKLEKTAGGWKWTETTSIPMAGVTQTTTLTFSDALEMGEVHQVGSQGGQQAKIDISYAGGRAKGKATTPAQGGPKTIDVDAEMPKGVIDDNALQGLMSVMRWKAGAKIPVAVFASGKGTVQQVSLNVVGEEKIKVIAGEFDAWKIELAGGEAPITFWLSKTMPSKVLKIAPGGAPIAMERVK